MKDIFIKSYKKEKFHVKKFSWKYWIAIFTESIAIILWVIGLYEIFLLKKSNPATLLIQCGGLLFTIGSFIFCKFVNIKN